MALLARDAARSIQAQDTRSIYAEATKSPALRRGSLPFAQSPPAALRSAPGAQAKPVNNAATANSNNGLVIFGSAPDECIKKNTPTKRMPPCG